MSSDKHPPINFDEVITRLTNENRQYLNILNEIKLILDLEKEFHGMTIVGGVKTLMKKYHDLQDKNYILEAKIKKLEK